MSEEQETPPAKHPSGRPSHIELVDAVDIGARFKETHPKGERGLCDFIEKNIDNFCNEIGYNNPISYERESFLVPLKRFGANKPHADFKIEIAPKKYLVVECKNPRHVYRELLNSLAQILGYAEICHVHAVSVEGYWIVTTRFDVSLSAVIKRYNLPISVCVISKDKIAVWKNE